MGGLLQDACARDFGDYEITRVQAVSSGRTVAFLEHIAAGDVLKASAKDFIRGGLLICSARRSVLSGSFPTVLCGVTVRFTRWFRGWGETGAACARSLADTLRCAERTALCLCFRRAWLCAINVLTFSLKRVLLHRAAGFAARNFGESHWHFGSLAGTSA